MSDYEDLLAELDLLLGSKIAGMKVALWPPTAGELIFEQEFLLELTLEKKGLEFKRIIETGSNQWSLQIKEENEIFTKGEIITESELKKIIDENSDDRDYYLVSNLSIDNVYQNAVISEILLFSIDEIENPYGMRIKLSNSARIDFFSYVDGGFVSMKGIHEDVSIFDAHLSLGELKTVKLE